METWETEKQKWYRDKYSSSLNSASESIEEGLNEFMESKTSLIRVDYKEKKLKTLLTMFFDKKRELEKRCHFCHVEVKRSKKEPYKIYNELLIDDTLYYDYFGRIEEFDYPNPKVTITKIVPGLPLEKASSKLLQKWYDFMKNHDYFESLQEFSSKLDFIDLFD